MDFPQFARVDLLDARPNFLLGDPMNPTDREVAIEQLLHLPSQPRGDVNAVGDVTDGHLFFVPGGLSYYALVKADLPSGLLYDYAVLTYPAP